jgi:hypothetical protein
MLAGDIFGSTPIWRSLWILKGIYYLVSIGNLRRTYCAWRDRRRNIRDLGELAGENVMEAR